MKPTPLPLLLVAACLSAPALADEPEAISCEPAVYTIDGSKEEIKKPWTACDEKSCGKTAVIRLADATTTTDSSYRFISVSEEDSAVYSIILQVERKDGKFALKKSKKYENGAWYTFDIEGECKALRASKSF